MQKIMFSDKYVLTEAVLDGRKTQTRRLARVTTHEFELLTGVYPTAPEELIDSIFNANSKFKVGDIVSIAQSYKDAGMNPNTLVPMSNGYKIAASNHKGWTNKMFVSASLMPRKIQITNIRLQRLQDISDEDCLKEGIVVNESKIKGGVKMYYPCRYMKECAEKVGWGRVYATPQEAFAVLIDKVGKKGDWDRNPYVWAYSFKLVK